ncbi:folliculin-interacting protein 1 [Condylostylus longicornis]|uniref:folliculin-interacting protein 1 n=1 Tax=Condylostylus longicornis TaxID=2530218 RepID=UPI00244DFFEE|nr:folliculin-interacting protein 1 [Condylostylus longicornis]XP_055373435.1 folliculin-interacting protein 1 [Condylostylus longicornis]XP_055373436.1 folliculin-interacting protein 1 [Condylostylus longicornis]XP_055373437.1 folliculin-interacting protein 1 [Condylostylus longicornis]XP_055373438.1 folliculin-interacting protein 1 [Condylostylus longicornis]
MALFNKFFFSSSNKKKCSNTNQNNFSPHFPFDSKQIRILLYRECDSSGRRLLFDSNSIQKIEINEKQNLKSNLQSNKAKLLGNLSKPTIKNENHLNDGSFIEIANGIGYKHIRPNPSDITNIGEMVFGALAMSFRSPSLKVHWLQAPSRLLCSQVFLSPIPGTNTGCLLNQRDLLSSSSTINSNNNLSPKRNFKKDTSESFDGYTVNSLSSALYSPNEYSRNLSMQLSTLPTIKDSNLIQKRTDQLIINKLNTPSADDVTPNIIGSDSGYATISDCWTSRSSCQYSTRSSMGSVLSDPLSTYDSLRKFSLDSGKSNFGDCGVISNSFVSSSFSTSTQQNSKASDMSINRRIARNMQTSFENRSSVCDFVGFICDNYQIAAPIGGSEGCFTNKNKISKSNSKQSHSSPEICKDNANSYNSLYNFFGVSSKTSSCKSNKINSKRSKLGLAVCISMTENHEKEMEEFCCEHIALLESMLSRLRASVEYAYLNHKKFLKIMLHAWQKTVEWILDFFTVSRLVVPVWHSSTFESKLSKHTADNFVKEFSSLLRTLDSKDTNFFISTMVTAVLTYHLGWVATITSISSPSTDFSSNTEGEIRNEKQNNLKNAAEQYPYNPLWAQMCDLYGAIGSPPRVSRTIISGKDKNLMEKFLHVLGYFIRCGEVHRNDIKRELEINSANEVSVDNTSKYKTIDDMKKPAKALGLSRKSTFLKNLSEISSFENTKVEDNQESFKPNCSVSPQLKFDKRNLRFDNLNNYDNNPFKKSESQEKIKVTVTTPEDIEMSLDDESFSTYSSNSNITQDGEALEAIEIQNSCECEWSVINNLETSTIGKLSFWKLEPEIKEGISCIDVSKLQQTIKINDGFYEVTNSKSVTTKSEYYENISLENSKSATRPMGPIDEHIYLEQQKHLEVSKEFIKNFNSENFKQNEKEIVHQEKTEGVLFVLGEDDHLVNIKKSNENIAIEEHRPKNKPTAGNYSKKHSGVKFNIEEYSESVNKLLNKQIDFQSKIVKIEKPLNNDFWTRCTCDSNNHTLSTSSTFDLNKNKSQNNIKNQKQSSNACEFCKTNIGETAKTNDKNIHVSYDERKGSNMKNKSGGSRKNSGNSPVKKIELQDDNISDLPISSRGLHLKKMFHSLKEKSRKLENFNFKILPMPRIENCNEKSNLNFNQANKNKNSKTDFISSLFVGVTDRYIPDMVLQGTLSSFDSWETNIKNDLVIASHCASLTTQPTENIAIIADMDKWEIKILSSQNYNLSSKNGSVGMSQLVSQLLEGFLILSNSGISSFECFTYLESKLKEIYLQSEALAEFLLTNEFCSLNSVTTALNLSENDVPLLLAIASIHSPQVTKRYGISFG